MNKLKIFIGVSLAAVAILAPDLVLAACSEGDKGFGGMGCRIAGATEGMSKATKSVGLLIGIGLSIGGLIGFATHKKTNTPLSIPIIMLVSGILLSSLTAFVDAGSETAFGSGTGNEWNQINN